MVENPLTTSAVPEKVETTIERWVRVFGLDEPVRASAGTIKLIQDELAEHNQLRVDLGGKPLAFELKPSTNVGGKHVESGWVLYEA